MDNKLFFTVINFSKNNKVTKINSIVKLTKDLDNNYDDEAILVEMRYIGKIGYVANSVETVIRGTYSAGRLYDKIMDPDYGKICFVINDKIICQLLTGDELENEKKDKDSDIHFLQ